MLQKLQENESVRSRTKYPPFPLRVVHSAKVHSQQVKRGRDESANRYEVCGHCYRKLKAEQAAEKAGEGPDEDTQEVCFRLFSIVVIFLFVYYFIFDFGSFLPKDP